MVQSSNGIELGGRLKAIVYTTFGLLTASGIGWALIDRFFTRKEVFINQPHASEIYFQRTHAFLAMVTLLLLGFLWAHHVQPALRAGKRRISGLFLIALNGCLALSGYGLYYASGERWRGILAITHLWAGVIFPLLLIGHIWIRPRSR